MLQNALTMFLLTRDPKLTCIMSLYFSQEYMQRTWMVLADSYFWHITIQFDWVHEMSIEEFPLETASSHPTQ